jgi:hypothetical protein
MDILSMLLKAKILDADTDEEIGYVDGYTVSSDGQIEFYVVCYEEEEGDPEDPEREELPDGEEVPAETVLKGSGKKANIRLLKTG